jgi:hypothetical protein
MIFFNVLCVPGKQREEREHAHSGNESGGQEVLYRFLLTYFYSRFCLLGSLLLFLLIFFPIHSSSMKRIEPVEHIKLWQCAV